MSTPLSVGGTTYDYPENKESQGWGEEATAWATAVTDALSGLSSPVDIPLTSAIINNNQSSPINVVGLFFDPLVVRGAAIEYTIYRTSSTITTPKAEKGVLEISYDGTDWTLARGNATADTGITFSFSPSTSGQIQYTSTDVGNVSYQGLMKFKASAYIQS